MQSAEDERKAAEEDARAKEEEKKKLDAKARGQARSAAKRGAQPSAATCNACAIGVPRLRLGFPMNEGDR